MSEINDQQALERLHRVREKIESACVRINRNPEDITLVAVTKGFPASVARTACRLNLLHIGENRLQEAVEKYKDGWLAREFPNVRLHLVGHLQSNKARRAVELFDFIDSVDTLKIARILDRLAAESGKILRILLEINASGEAQKYGMEPDQAPDIASKISELNNLELAGLMTVGPNVDDPVKIRKSFQLTRSIFDKIASGLSDPKWSVLSMGMSGDFEIAIEEGATEIRLGTALWGARS